MSESDLKITSLKTLKPFLLAQDNAKNVVYASDVPAICKDEPCMLGVDEAGRGPVLGPMVYGIAYCPLSKAEHLKTLGCADSKQLTEEKRELIFDDITTKDYCRESIGWCVEVISPNTISNCMLRRTKYSLNEVSMGSAIGLIQKALELGANIKEVYVDTVGPPEKYQEKLSKIFPGIDITVAKKADSTYPIVSAASICAKVTRDMAIKGWQFREGIEVDNFGSGYPGDPVTKNFLRNNIDPVFGYPRLVRFSWSTAANALKGQAFDVQFDDEEEEADLSYTGTTMTSFYKSAKNSNAPRKRHVFFQQRFLNNATEL